MNPGDRPSRLALGRHATGEAPLEDLSAASQAYVAALEAERARVEPFDFEVLRAAAARLADEPTPDDPMELLLDDLRAPPAPLPWWRRALLVVPVLAVAVGLLLGIPSGPREPTNRTKGAADLGFYVLRDGQVLPGDPEATFHEGDRIQFTYRTNADRLVLLSIDGDGVLTLFYPEAGEEGVAVTPGSRHVLERSILLDDAPGPEIFLAFFGESWGVTRARAAAEAAWNSGGADALLALPETSPDIAVLPLERE